jgi:hypothetical protein
VVPPYGVSFVMELCFANHIFPPRLADAIQRKSRRSQSKIGSQIIERIGEIGRDQFAAEIRSGAYTSRSTTHLKIADLITMAHLWCLVGTSKSLGAVLMLFRENRS